METEIMQNDLNNQWKNYDGFMIFKILSNFKTQLYMCREQKKTGKLLFIQYIRI